MSLHELYDKRVLPIDQRVHPLVKWASAGIRTLESKNLFHELGLNAKRRTFLAQFYTIDPFSHDYCKFWVASMPSFRIGLADLLQLLTSKVVETGDTLLRRQADELIEGVTEQFDLLGEMASKLTTVDTLIGKHYSLLAERSAPNTNYALSGGDARAYLSSLYKVIGDSLFDGPSRDYYERYLRTASHIITPELLHALENAEVDIEEYMMDHEQKLAELDIAIELLA